MVRYIIFIVLSLYPLIAISQPVAPKIIPLGEKIVLYGGTYKCYQLEDYKLLLDFDYELYTKRMKLHLLEKRDVQTQEALYRSQRIGELLKEDKALLEEELHLITRKWESGDEELHALESGRDICRIMGVAGVGVSVLMTALLFVSIY